MNHRGTETQSQKKGLGAGSWVLGNTATIVDSAQHSATSTQPPDLDDVEGLSRMTLKKGTKS